MPQEMVQEAVEIVTMSVDKFINVKNYEVRLFHQSAGGYVSHVGQIDHDLDPSLPF